jgi:hypothetical protein
MVLVMSARPKCNQAPAKPPARPPASAWSKVETRRPAVAVTLALLVWILPNRAAAWQDARQTGSDIVLRVDPNGVASVAVRLRWRVVRGPMKAIDLAGVDGAIAIDPSVVVTADDGRTLSAHALRTDDDTVRIAMDDPRALTQGGFALEAHWRLDLVASGALVRDAAMWRIRWSPPVASDGFDGARTVLDLPAALEPPELLAEYAGAPGGVAAATLRREIDRDVLQWERPHVAQGESAAWSVRIDPKALAQVPGRFSLPQAAQMPLPSEPNRVREVSLAVASAGLGLLFGLLVAYKLRAFGAACALHDVRSRGLLPLPDGIRAGIAGAAFAVGVGLEVAGFPTAGAGCVAVATLAASSTASASKGFTRGKGRWLALRPEDAFAKQAPSASHCLDVGSRTGRVAAACCGALASAVALGARHFAADGLWLMLLDSVVLVPLFVTGVQAQLPPSPGRSVTPWMARALGRLRTDPTLRVAPWARVVDAETVASDEAGSSLQEDAVAAADPRAAVLPPALRDAVDELRLRVCPRASVPGLVGIEIGLALSHTPVGWATRPEVLARVINGSSAAAKLSRELPGARLGLGRRIEERVVVLVPRSPSLSCTVALVRAAAAALTDRRTPSPARAWTALERRGPALKASRKPADTSPQAA